jgi:hypothetical protein
VGGVDRERKLRPAKTDNVKSCFFIVGLQLLPITWVVDIVRLNVKLSGQLFYECPHPFCLEVCRAGGFVIGYNADSDSLTTAVPGSVWYDGPLPLPLFGRLYLAVIGAEAITDNKVTVEVLRAGQAAERGQLFNVSSFGGTIVDFDAIPTMWGLGSLGRNGFFDGVETVIAGEAKRSGGGGVVAQHH